MIWPKAHLNFEALKRKRLDKIGKKFGTLTICTEGVKKKICLRLTVHVIVEKKS